MNAVDHTWNQFDHPTIDAAIVNELIDAATAQPRTQATIDTAYHRAEDQ